MFDVMKAVMKWKGDGEKRIERKVWECIWCRKDGWWNGMILRGLENGAMVQVIGEHSRRNGKTEKEEERE